MRYFHQGFLTSKMYEYGIDVVDATVLRWFIDFQNSDKVKTLTDRGKIYYCVKYEEVKNDLYFLRFRNKRTISARFDRLVEAGVLEKKMVYDGGTFTYFTYFRTTDRLKKLLAE